MPSPRAGFAELIEAQAGKATTINEALYLLEALTVGGVVDRDLTAPPLTPVNGEIYIPAATATGAWAGKETNLAQWLNGSWRFFAPQLGWHVLVIDESTAADAPVMIWWDGAQWE